MALFLSLDEASDRLGVHVSTFRQWIRDGLVPAYRVGQRFTRVDWEEVLAAIRTAEPKQPERRGEPDSSEERP